MDKDSHWCLCGTPYELLECLYADAGVTRWSYYCFSCGAIEDASEHVEKKRAQGNGKEYRGAL
jgi:hypothetical protein